MSIIPIRDLGSSGVITDHAPYNLPINAFSIGLNVRFDEGKVTRAPIFRTIKASLGFNPRFTMGINPASGYDKVLMVSDDYAIHEYANGATNNRSGSISGSTDPRPFTGASLADVSYLNRPDRVPVYRDGGSTNFADLPNWTSTWRTSSLRAYGSFLLGLNMTEGSTYYPNRVRWSNTVTANTYPDSWSESDTTKSAGFNDLVEMTSEIIDGATLGSNFIIYGSSEVILMEFVGGTFIFNFRQLFTDAGLINQNCVAEIEGKHFCFGHNDIFVHDGTTKQSICDERVRNFIYQGLNTQNANRFFVQHNKSQSEVMFCYQSGDQYVAFPNANRCNRAAVFNYKNNTWSFMDLPNVSSGTTANVNSVTTYASSTGLTYELVGGSYYDQEDNFDRHTLMVGEDDSSDGISSDKLYGVDLSDTGKLTFQLDTEATKPPFIERTGIDLDEAGSAASNYVVVTRLYPQADTDNTSDTTLTFQFGASDIPRVTPTYESAVTFDVSTDHKIDARAAGRYLSYKMTLADDDYKDFQLSGFDLDVTITGAR
jgi:hypothetical protein